MAASALSPASSPRLPSPPPIAEDQLGPKSPTAGTDDQLRQIGAPDLGASRRIRPGTKAVDMAEGPPLVDLSELASAFPLTEHLKALHNFLTHPIGSNSLIPVDREMAYKLAQPPENTDKSLWLYELCRFLIQKVNSIIIALFADNPPCSAATCQEMRASEWQYLCAVHDPPKSCCAIDYCCHTLDWAANNLCSQKNFPYRTQMGGDAATQHQQIRLMTNIFRRVYRIFAHAWFQHREVFWKVEGRTGLYIFFKTVCDVYGLIPEDNYTIPSEAEGIEPSTQQQDTQPPSFILRREPAGPISQESEASSIVEGIPDHTLSTAGTTKRHRHSPSVGATSVTTVVEENEEEEEQPAREDIPRVEVEPPRETESAAEEPTSTQDPPIGEAPESAGEPAPLTEASPPEEASDEAEKQAPSEVEQDDPQPHKEGESGAPDDQTTVSDPAASEEAKEEEEEEEKDEAEAKPSETAEETSAPVPEPEITAEKAETEKEDKDADSNSAAEVKDPEPGEKEIPGSEE
ncbi:Mob1/phocein [Lophiotrema nucula]|uniref:Mob1/phocein n=1 Tax=Lophiotrema nucula TaxID=690887 RepID=A0A6A5Z4T7_9PLEO|nr:Mob1/phocein [Lophiotrema nucula]